MSDVQDTVTEEPDSAPPPVSETETLQDSTAATETGEKTDLDSLLTEYDEASKGADALDQIIAEAEGFTGNDLEQMLAESNRNMAIAEGRLDVRDETIAAMQRAEHNRQETEALIAYGREVVDKLPETLPDREDFVQNELIKIAATDQAAKLAFDLRNVDPQAARQEMARLEFAWNKLQASNNRKKKGSREPFRNAIYWRRPRTTASAS